MKKIIKITEDYIIEEIEGEYVKFPVVWKHDFEFNKKRQEMLEKFGTYELPKE